MLSRAKFKCQFIIENELHSNFNFTICMRVFDGIIFAASGFFFFFLIYCFKYLFCHLFRFFVLMLWSYKKLIKINSIPLNFISKAPNHNNNCLMVLYVESQDSTIIQRKHVTGSQYRKYALSCTWH